MATKKLQSPMFSDTNCGSLLQDLELIWDEVGASDGEREKMLLQLEQECLEVYRRKVDQANLSRARLHQLLADSEVELEHLISALGERSFVGRPEKQTGTLKEQLAAIAPGLGDLRKKKEERVKKFMDVQGQIQSICAEIAGILNVNDLCTTPKVDEHDLSLKKLDEFHAQLQELHREKNDRLQKVFDYVNTVHALSAVMGLDFSKIVSEVHPSLDDSAGNQSKSISNDTLVNLAKMVESLKEEKQQRLQKSGCCKPPTPCGYSYVNATFWTGTLSYADSDCSIWSDDQSQLCYDCDSCKAGVLANLKHDWHKVSVLNIVIFILLVVVYVIGCGAFKNNIRRDNYESHGEATMTKSQPSRLHF